MENWLSLFPALDVIDNEVKTLLLNQTSLVHLEKGQVVFTSGSDCNRYLLVRSGRIRVQQVSRLGREITLYHIHDGEACILTTACLFARKPYPAMAITEVNTDVAVLPLHAFERAIAFSPDFRKFVMQAYGDRLTDMLMLIEEVVFTRLDVRLARKLLAMASSSGSIVGTHQELATELGSVREVVSRTLAEFERRGLIRRGIRTVDIIDWRALEVLAEDG
ncbi:Crp/Fnr family transcriptional regulator [Acidihalobacter aeolianus]|uniref:Crp/Fnr family transcriptional regulator n=1 Tax=Acidihalobacter aeolianus TaxID=2792603 RepID=UPI0009F63601|nr:Crp/Fnr family transcriptional regulator [Acidihalobacter aeolianus]